MDNSNEKDFGVETRSNTSTHNCDLQSAIQLEQLIMRINFTMLQIEAKGEWRKKIQEFIMKFSRKKKLPLRLYLHDSSCWF